MATRRSFLLGAAASTPLVLAGSSAKKSPAAHVYETFGEMQARYVGVVDGRERWAYRSPLVNAPNDLVSGPEYTIDVVAPDNYPANGPYPILFLGPVEPSPSLRLGDGLKIAKGLNVHNAHNCLLVTMTCKTAPWYGSRPDGTAAIDRHVLQSVLPLVVAKYNGSPARDDHLLIGFSKSGFGAASLLLRHPGVFGYAACWDVPWSWTISESGIAAAFGTAAQFALYDPKTILPTHLASLDDRPRLWVGGGRTFNADFKSWCALLASHRVPYLSHFALAPKHQWDANWVRQGIDALFEMKRS